MVDIGFRISVGGVVCEEKLIFTLPSKWCSMEEGTYYTYYYLRVERKIDECLSA